MKKIGILFGKEDTFPQAFINRVNEKNVDGIVAEAVSVADVVQGKATEYAVIIDRISQDVPFYRSYLKNAAIAGTAVINNPFWWSADEKFINNAIALKVGVPVPKTVLLPSKERPDDTSAASFRNLKMMPWEEIFEYIGGFPAFMKPHSGGGWKSVYKVSDPTDLFSSYDETGQLVMMLQENIDFESYFRCYCIGGNNVHIMPYEPRNPHHLRYLQNAPEYDPALLATIEDYVIRLNHALGYDFNTVEFAVRDGVPYAIDFCNPAPDADFYSVGEDNFEWIVEAAANMAIARAQSQEFGKTNLSWGSFVRQAVVDGSGFANPSLEAAFALPNTTENKVEVSGADSEVAVEEMELEFPIVEEELVEKGAVEVATAEADAGEAANAATGDDTTTETTGDSGLTAEQEETKEALLSTIGQAEEAEKQDLTRIKGVGPKMQSILYSLNIFTFAQISKMGDAEYQMVDDLLTVFKGRGKRDDWSGQAKAILAAEG